MQQQNTSQQALPTPPVALNRAQRRFQKKGRSIKVLDKKATWERIETMVTLHRVDDIGKEACQKLAVPAYLALEAIVKDTFDEEAANGLCHYLVYGQFLCRRSQEFSSSPESRAAVMQCATAVNSGLKAIYAVGVRHKEEGRYRVTASDLECLRDATDVIRQLTDLSSVGHTVAAVIESNDLVQKCGNATDNTLSELLNEIN